jgi:hypothetical protein
VGGTCSSWSAAFFCYSRLLSRRSILLAPCCSAMRSRPYGQRETVSHDLHVLLRHGGKYPLSPKLRLAIGPNPLYRRSRIRQPRTLNGTPTSVQAIAGRRASELTAARPKLTAVSPVSIAADAVTIARNAAGLSRVASVTKPSTASRPPSTRSSAFTDPDRPSWPDSPTIAASGWERARFQFRLRSAQRRSRVPRAQHRGQRGASEASSRQHIYRAAIPCLRTRTIRTGQTARPCRVSQMRPRGFEPPRPIRVTRPSTWLRRGLELT